MKTRKQNESYVGDDFIIDYVTEMTFWAGDNETSPATKCQIKEAYLTNLNKQVVKLSDGFIEAFLEPKLLYFKRLTCKNY